METKYVRNGMQILKVEGNWHGAGIDVFHWKDESGTKAWTIGSWVYETETEAYGKLVEDLEFSLERARERLYEIEGLE